MVKAAVWTIAQFLILFYMQIIFRFQKLFYAVNVQFILLSISCCSKFPTLFSQYVKRILNKTLNKIYAGRKRKLQRFRICFAQNRLDTPSQAVHCSAASAQFRLNRPSLTANRFKALTESILKKTNPESEGGLQVRLKFVLGRFQASF